MCLWTYKDDLSINRYLVPLQKSFFSSIWPLKLSNRRYSTSNPLSTHLHLDFPLQPLLERFSHGTKLTREIKRQLFAGLEPSCNWPIWNAWVREILSLYQLKVCFADSSLTSSKKVKPLMMLSREPTHNQELDKVNKMHWRCRAIRKIQRVKPTNWHGWNPGGAPDGLEGRRRYWLHNMKLAGSVIYTHIVYLEV